VQTAEAEVRAAESEGVSAAWLGLARVGQTYETTIRADGMPSMRFVSVAGRVLGPQAMDAVEFLRILGLAELESRRFFPAELPWVLWECLAARRPITGNRRAWSDEDRRLFEFAEYLTFEDLIPFELSEQRSRSLGKLMLGGATIGAAVGGAKVGAAGGIILGATGGPLIFITVPAGFIVGGLVGAVTGTLGYKLSDFLRGSPDPDSS
jgi:hypothetical protein